jgi:hypothetical protein
MEYPPASNSEHLTDERLVALWRACESDDTAPLAQFIQLWDPSTHELNIGLQRAIEGGYLNTARFLLEHGVPFNGDLVRLALKGRSFPILEVLRQFGWGDVDMKVAKGTALTALA